MLNVIRSRWPHLIIGTVVCVPLAMLVNRAPCVEFEGGYIAPNPAAKGTAISIVWRVKPGADRCEGEVIPRVIDSNGDVFEYEPRRTVYHERGLQFSKPLKLPDRIAAGPARYEAVVLRWRNVVQKIFWKMPDDPAPLYFVVAEQPE